MELLKRKAMDHQCNEQERADENGRYQKGNVGRADVHGVSTFTTRTLIATTRSALFVRARDNRDVEVETPRQQGSGTTASTETFSGNQ